jgi:flagellar protein FlgJ
MIRLDNQYKPIYQKQEQLNLNKNQYKKVQYNDFKQEFVKIHNQFINPTQQEQNEVVWEKSKEMETQFVKMMVDEMKKNIHKTGFIHGGQAEEMFSSMLNEQYAEQMTENSDFGIAQSIYNQITGSYR